MVPKDKLLIFVLISILAINLFTETTKADEPWTAKQLMPPAELNKMLLNPKAPKIYIFSIGYQAIIKNSIDIGPGSDAANRKKLMKQLKKIKKDANIVIYCGCCPFSRCPNVRPVFDMLNNLGFTNHKLLNLPQNIKVDWIDKGYETKK